MISGEPGALREELGCENESWPERKGDRGGGRRVAPRPGGRPRAAGQPGGRAAPGPRGPFGRPGWKGGAPAPARAPRPPRPPGTASPSPGPPRELHSGLGAAPSGVPPPVWKARPRAQHGLPDVPIKSRPVLCRRTKILKCDKIDIDSLHNTAIVFARRSCRPPAKAWRPVAAWRRPRRARARDERANARKKRWCSGASGQQTTAAHPSHMAILK